MVVENTKSVQTNSGLKKKVIRYVLITILTVAVVFLLGWLFDDKYYLGSITLCFGMIQVTLMMKGTWIAELMALLECIAGVVIYVFNGLWGTVIFSVIIYIPLNIYGIFSWKNNQVDGVIKINKLTWKKFLAILAIVVGGTALLSFLLSLIPSQKFSILDSASNMFNILGIVLLNMRYKEGWFSWIACNIVESVTWILFIVSRTGASSVIMLIICIVYLILDVFAYKSFVKLNTKQTAMIVTKNK